MKAKVILNFVIKKYFFEKIKFQNFFLPLSKNGKSFFVVQVDGGLGFTYKIDHLSLYQTYCLKMLAIYSGKKVKLAKVSELYTGN